MEMDIGQYFLSGENVRIFLLVVQLLLAFVTVHAQTYEITSVNVSGSGCPVGSVGVTLSPDLKSISILFDKFAQSAVKGNNSIASLRKSCQFRLGVHVTPGYNLEATTLQYRGFTDLPVGVKASVATSGPILRASRFVGNQNAISSVFSSVTDNFFIEHKIMQNFKQSCQNQTAIIFDTTLVLSGQSNRFTNIFPRDSQIVIDSLDSGPNSSPVELGVQLTPCQ